MKFRMTIYSHIFGVLLCVAVPVLAQTSDSTKAATATHQNKAYQIKIQIYKPLAEAGNTEAQNNLGVMYANGQGVSQSDIEAVKWYRKAAEQGRVEAQLNLGNAYANGLGIPQSYEHALNWYHKAEEQGLASAQFNIGVMYDNGLGVPKSKQMAISWFKKAALLGSSDAKSALKSLGLE